MSSYFCFSCFLTIRLPPRSTLFPYTTLFRSTMTNLSTECLIQLTKLGYDATPFNQILKQNAKREMRLRLGKECRSEERFSRNAETDLVCRLLLEKKKGCSAYLRQLIFLQLLDGDE